MIPKYLTHLRDSKRFVPRTILDIGANVGNFSRTCKQIWPFTKVIMFEGNMACTYPLATIGDPFHIVLLGDEDNKPVTFYGTSLTPTCTGNSIYRENTSAYNDEKVIKEKRKLVKLDTLMKKHTGPIDFAKLDTQGSELDILKGGVETLSQCKYILIEVSLKYYNDGIPLKADIVNFMSSMGYNNREIVDHHIWQSNEKLDGFNIGDVFQEDIMFIKD